MRLVHLEDSSGGSGGCGGGAEDLLDVGLEDSDVEGDFVKVLRVADEEGVLLALEDVVDGTRLSDDTEESVLGFGGGGVDQLLDGLGVDDSVGVGSLPGPELEVSGSRTLDQFEEVDVTAVIGVAGGGVFSGDETFEVEECVEIF